MNRIEEIFIYWDAAAIYALAGSHMRELDEIIGEPRRAFDAATCHPIDMAGKRG
jgi:hypothetical protein